MIKENFTQSQLGETALMYAVKNKSADFFRDIIFKDLINARTDVNIQSQLGETALMWAISYNQVDIFK